MELLHEVLSNIVDIAIIIFEFIGVTVIIVSGLQGIIGYIRRNPLTRLNLAKGMAMGLEFKLGSEILRTVVVRDFSEILTVAGIIALRAALTFLIHWEIKNEEANTEIIITKEKEDKLTHKNMNNL
ncbi:DUF1622 domain-containing protein [Clostridium polynesiense]|uniref:DUF1622 domain-containing protein n=1 Tax=Clostridium polynesiense TaxID=1325933 RepID=UPI00059110FB|nr:DUF1622 domain-containing protein [Clostridium polynesiense]